MDGSAGSDGRSAHGVALGHRGSPRPFTQRATRAGSFNDGYAPAMVDPQPSRAWVVLLADSKQTDAVFSTFAKVKAAVSQERASALITEFPLDTGAWDAAVASGGLRLKRPDQSAPDFVGDFTNPCLEHVHAEGGRCDLDRLTLDTPAAPPGTRWWVFSGGSRPAWASGVFTTFGAAQAWIAGHQLTGWLTEHVVDPSRLHAGVGEAAPGQPVRRAWFAEGLPRP